MHSLNAGDASKTGKLTSKQRGDAGEYYVCAMLGFAGIPTAKMPDNWPDYDLMADIHGRQLKIQVKTMSYTAFYESGWNPNFPPAMNFDYLAIVVTGEEIEAWMLPKSALVTYLRKPQPSAATNNWRIPKKFLLNELMNFRNNWLLDPST